VDGEALGVAPAVVRRWRVLRVLGRLQCLCVLALLLGFVPAYVLGRAAAPWDFPPFAGFAVVSVAYALLWRCPACGAWLGPGRPRPSCPSCGVRLHPDRSPGRRWEAWMGWLVVGGLVAWWFAGPGGLGGLGG
jgi:hypothetical protein